MSIRKRVTVRQWIEEALTDEDKGKPCSVISLIHIKGVSQEEIHTKDIVGAQDFAKLSDFFINKACGYAQDLSDIQNFKLLAFYGQTEPQASFPFTVSEGQLTAGQDVPFSKHEPTEKGALALALKHLDHALSINLQMTQGIVANAVQREREIQQEQREMTVCMRDMLLGLRKETAEIHMKELEYARATEERRMIGKAAPAILNYLTGREVVPETYADSELIDIIGEKISPEDLQMLVQMGKIKPEVAALLAQRFMKSRDENEKRQKALRNLPSEEMENSSLAELNGKGDLQ